MPASSANGSPGVSIILPTYNRVRFLPQAFEAICAQTWTDWELIVVDDGSTDHTKERVEQLRDGIQQPLRYVYQENQGAYGARNTGLDLARGGYIAFYDSDDYWLPHHLQDCATALEANPQVDWVYGASRLVEHATGKELSPHSFYVAGTPRPLLQLRSRGAGRLRIIEDPDAVRCQILHGLYCGLQNSVIRRNVFASYRFATQFRNEAEDQVVVIQSLKAGHRFAYFDQVHLTYHVHAENSSAAGVGVPVEKQLRVYRALFQGFELMKQQVRFTPSERRALDKRMGCELFWHMGYSLLWQHGRRREALSLFRRGLCQWPWDWRCWKTYAIAHVRTLVRL